VSETNQYFFYCSPLVGRIGPPQVIQSS
jgi:hypothetical protein